MKRQNLKRYSKSELLEIIIQLTKERNELQAQLDIANEKLRDRIIIMENAGSIAEAALQLNDIFAKAQETADQYVQSVIAKQNRDGL